MNWLKKLWRKMNKGKPREIVIEDEVSKILCDKPVIVKTWNGGKRIVLTKDRKCEECFFFCNGRCHLNGICIPEKKIPMPSPIVLAADRVRHEQLHRETDRPEDRLQIMTAEEHIELHRRRG